jgi:membrane protein YqaA with SNARE-associated domain
LIDGIRELLAELTRWMTGFAGTPWATPALFAFSFAESSFFPIPPDVLLIVLCVGDAGIESLWLCLSFALVCSVASVLGGLFGYVIGLKGGRPLLDRIFAREKILAVERAFERHGVWAVAAAGFTPIPYKVFTISSGAFRMNWAKFALASAVSRSARFFMVAVACHVLGDEVRDFMEHNFGLFSVLFFAALVGGFLLVKHASRRYVKDAPPVTAPDTDRPPADDPDRPSNRD